MAISASAWQRKCDAGVISRSLIGQLLVIRSQRWYRRVQEPWSCASGRSYKEGIICCPRGYDPALIFTTTTFDLIFSIPIIPTTPTFKSITDNIEMACCGRNNGECVCAKEATCSCGKQPALQCSMPLFLHPHPSCNYCFQDSASHVI